IRNPWPGQSIEVVNASGNTVVVQPTTAAGISVPVTSGQSYLVERTGSPTTSLPFAQVSGTPATTAKHLGNVQIGLDGNGTTTPPTGTPVISLRAHANGDYVTAGASPLIADKTSIGTSEQFDEIDEGGGYIALKAHANNLYVTA
ncbi:carbohydrate-binding protein, partial [Streptomyces sp. SID4948]|nr:carbohydrate-binding protein [Streptomyces sp. SID4948]